MSNLTQHKCFNKHCDAFSSAPGRCEICAKVWKETCDKAQAWWSERKLKNESEEGISRNAII